MGAVHIKVGNDYYTIDDKDDDGSSGPYWVIVVGLIVLAWIVFLAIAFCR